MEGERGVIDMAVGVSVGLDMAARGVRRGGGWGWDDGHVVACMAVSECVHVVQYLYGLKHALSISGLPSGPASARPLNHVRTRGEDEGV